MSCKDSPLLYLAQLNVLSHAEPRCLAVTLGDDYTGLSSRSLGTDALQDQGFQGISSSTENAGCSKLQMGCPVSRKVVQPRSHQELIIFLYLYDFDHISRLILFQLGAPSPQRTSHCKLLNGKWWVSNIWGGNLCLCRICRTHRFVVKQMADMAGEPNMPGVHWVIIHQFYGATEASSFWSVEVCASCSSVQDGLGNWCSDTWWTRGEHEVSNHGME